VPHSASPSSPFLSSQPLPSLSGNPDHTVPWGMQIAVRYDKVHPPRRIDVAEAAARAVVSLLASPAAAPGVVDVNKGQLTEGTPAHAAKSGK